MKKETEASYIGLIMKKHGSIQDNNKWSFDIQYATTATEETDKLLILVLQWQKSYSMRQGFTLKMLSVLHYCSLAFVYWLHHIGSDLHLHVSFMPTYAVIKTDYLSDCIAYCTLLDASITWWTWYKYGAHKKTISFAVKPKALQIEYI